VWPRWEVAARNWVMNPAVPVLDSDEVISSGEQLHEVLRDRGILHLLYVGFATNWCILGRDYGIRAMRNRGYNTILLRDATTGVEFPDTLDTLFATEISIREAEQMWGFTASNPDFFTACQAASAA
jgi:nicotinamidase-related amidase